MTLTYINYISPLNPIESHQIPLKHHEIPWNPMKSPLNPMKPHEIIKFVRNQTEVEHLITARLDTSSSKRRVEEAGLRPRWPWQQWMMVVIVITMGFHHYMTGWWFQTWMDYFPCHINGMSSETHWLSLHHFSRWLCGTSNQFSIDLTIIRCWPLNKDVQLLCSYGSLGISPIKLVISHIVTGV